MKIKFIKVGGINYAVEYIENLCDESGKLDGRIKHSETRMQIESGMSEQAKAQSILHEAVHALTTQSGRQDISRKEDLIDSLAYGIYQIIHDNPDLINWIVGL